MRSFCCRTCWTTTATTSSLSALLPTPRCPCLTRNSTPSACPAGDCDCWLGLQMLLPLYIYIYIYICIYIYIHLYIYIISGWLERLTRVGLAVSAPARAGQPRTRKTVKARFWPWLSGKSPQTFQSCYLFARTIDTGWVRSFCCRACWTSHTLHPTPFNHPPGIRNPKPYTPHFPCLTRNSTPIITHYYIYIYIFI